MDYHRRKVVCFVQTLAGTRRTYRSRLAVSERTRTAIKHFVLFPQKFNRVESRLHENSAVAGVLMTSHKVNANKNEPGTQKKFCILTVCLGNLCRSPAAEAILKKKIAEQGLENWFYVDSCGTGGGNPDWYIENGWSYHEGDRADPRMVRIASERNIKVDSISRPMKPDDLEKFDLIVVMDAENEREVRKAAAYWGKKYVELAKSKVEQITKYCRHRKDIREVPDPWYHGGDSMRLVLDILEDACEGLLQSVTKQLNLEEQRK
jgi:protein-tyrosine phosphatase